MFHSLDLIKSEMSRAELHPISGFGHTACKEVGSLASSFCNWNALFLRLMLFSHFFLNHYCSQFFSFWKSEKKKIANRKINTHHSNPTDSKIIHRAALAFHLGFSCLFERPILLESEKLTDNGFSRSLFLLPTVSVWPHTHGGEETPECTRG